MVMTMLFPMTVVCRLLSAQSFKFQVKQSHSSAFIRLLHCFFIIFAAISNQLSNFIIMKNIFLIALLVAMSIVGAWAQNGKVDAFPGAEGAGRYTTGGRGGVVYHVTSLEDDGAKKGTLRYAINQKGPRTIVFDVAGVIELKSRLSIRNGDLTIAGQTAPGDGICLKNYGFQVSSNNVIIRFMRSRLGDDKSDCEDDAVSAFSSSNGLSNIIIDHCSASWSIDECLSCYGVKNLTVQWCYITESLYHSIHGKGTHGYGGIWGGCPATFHHNLIAHHSSRNPRLCGSRFNNDAAHEMVDLRNNVFYNFGPINSGYAGEGGCYNFINNCYKPGPMTATKASLCNRIFQASPDDGSNKQAKGVWGTFHLSGNWFDTSCPDLTQAEVASGEAVNANNWAGLHVNGSPLPGGSKLGIESQSAFACASVTTHSAQDALERVLTYGGCSFARDAIDARIAGEVESGTYTFTGSKGGTLGLIDTPSDVGGYPAYTCTPAQQAALSDENNNGIPDSKEEVLFGGLVDGNGHDKSDVYTNLEYYLNFLVRKITEGQLEGGVPSVDGSGSQGGGDENAEAFMATENADGSYDYFWFSKDNAAQVENWLVDGTIVLTDASYNKDYSNTESSHTGAITLKKGTGEIVFKCPAVSSFALYMFRTGSFAGSVSVSADGTNFEEVYKYSGGKYILELDATPYVSSDNEIYVKISNAATGTLAIQGVKILRPDLGGNGISKLHIASGLRVSGDEVVAFDALNIRAYTPDGSCVAAEVGNRLSLAGLQHGIYVIRVVESNGNIIVRKIVK